MRQVIKRGGGRQRFSPGKIRRSIRRVARDAKASPQTRRKLREIAKEVIAKFKERKLIRSIEIKKAVVNRLNRQSKAAASAWKRYEKKKAKETKKK